MLHEFIRIAIFLKLITYEKRAPIYSKGMKIFELRCKSTFALGPKAKPATVTAVYSELLNLAFDEILWHK